MHNKTSEEGMIRILLQELRRFQKKKKKKYVSWRGTTVLWGREICNKQSSEKQ